MSGERTTVSTAATRARQIVRGALGAGAAFAGGAADRCGVEAGRHRVLIGRRERCRLAEARRRSARRDAGRLLVGHARRRPDHHRARHDQGDGALQRPGAARQQRPRRRDGPGRGGDARRSDAKQWTVRLRQGLTFHNGKPVTPDDVIFSLQADRRSEEPRQRRQRARAARRRTRSRCIDDRTLRLPMKVPYASFLEQICEHLQLPDHPDATTTRRTRSAPGRSSTRASRPASERVREVPRLPPEPGCPTSTRSRSSTRSPRTRPRSTRSRAASWTCSRRLR